jgi:Na+/H+ antiporter NhaA
MKKSVIHAIAGSIAMLLIASFWTSTLVSELFLGTSAIVAVKQAIAQYGLICLVFAMVATGGSGFALGRGRKGRLIEEKKKRMPFIGGNGVLVMIPSAIYLSIKASAGEFDSAFYAVQVIELLVGLIQLTLMGKNFKTGLQLSGRLRASPKQ